MLSLFSNRSTDHEASGKDCVAPCLSNACVGWSVGEIKRRGSGKFIRLW